ncbi:hypothetical protein KCU68_g16068, partial [Aureobasidium melanogenum]
AILVLIVIACSGFFVAFTLSFSEEKAEASKVAYALFQLTMGFTPAAWDLWPKYNLLGKAVLVGFLFLCHFLIVTILITVLTNSFMAIVQNANEEHQFLFAVNTISMVKSDALFSYIPPTNLFGWVVSPLRYVIPFRKFVRFNRTIIKVTHLPMLFAIFTYERLFLVRNAYTPMDLVERKAPRRGRLPAFSMKNTGPFSPGTRLREPSIVSFHKDRALEEVFRRPFDMTTRTISQHSNPDQRKATVVDNWMQDMGDEGGASPPMEQPRSVLERLENRRPGIRRAHTSANRTSTIKRDFSTASRSVLSDPEDLASTIFPRPTPMRIEEETDLEMEREDMPQETDADGDDELLTNDGDNITATGYDRTPTGTPDLIERKDPSPDKPTAKDYFEGADFQTASSVPNATRARLMSGEHKREGHRRNVSHGTMVFSPIVEQGYTSSASEHVPKQSRPTTSKQNSGGSTPLAPSAPQSSGRKTPRTSNPSRVRPNMPNRLSQYTAPNIRFDRFGDSTRRANRQPSFNALALDLASDFGDHHRRDLTPEPLSPGYQPSIPASFSEQMLRERELALDKERRRQEQRRRSQEEEKGMVGRIMLTRMNTLEEGFREILREVRDLAHTSRGTSDAGMTGMVNSRSSLVVPASSDGNALSRPKTPVSRTGGASERARSPKKGKGKNKSKGRNSIHGGSEADPVSPLTVQEGPSQATSPTVLEEPETPATVRALSTPAEEGTNDDQIDTGNEFGSAESIGGAPQVASRNRGAMGEDNTDPVLRLQSHQSLPPPPPAALKDVRDDAQLERDQTSTPHSDQHPVQPPTVPVNASEQQHSNQQESGQRPAVPTQDASGVSDPAQSHVSQHSTPTLPPMNYKHQPTAHTPAPVSATAPVHAQNGHHPQHHQPPPPQHLPPPTPAHITNGTPSQYPPHGHAPPPPNYTYPPEAGMQQAPPSMQSNGGPVNGYAPHMGYQ